MSLISIVIIGFVVLETTNVIALYFFPGTKYANSVGVFKAWEEAQQDPEINDFVEQGLFYTALALVIAISSFFWRLFPLIRKMDREEQIDPKNYSAILSLMIATFMLVFLVAMLISGTG
jgi:p-aminobenzoyl-glutamate transporter AbgT